MQKGSISAFFLPNLIRHVPNIHSNAFNSVYRTTTHVHNFSLPQIRRSAPCQHHPPADNQSTTNYIKNKIGSPVSLSVSLSLSLSLSLFLSLSLSLSLIMWFLTRSIHRDPPRNGMYLRSETLLRHNLILQDFITKIKFLKCNPSEISLPGNSGTQCCP